MSLEAWRQRHQALVAIAPEQRRRAEIVIVGDSIVEGWDAGVWQEFYAPYHALKLGIGGDRTQQVLWRMEHGELDGLAPRALVLLIGTNNIGDEGASPDTIARGVAKVVEVAQRRLPTTQVLVVGVLPRGERPGDPMRAEVTAINTRLAKLGDGARVRYVDIGARFLEPNGSIRRDVMGDFLHPTARGYRIFAEAIAPTLEALAGKP
jgi:beta-glucosidase